VTDWLLASLLNAEDDGSLHKRSVLSGSGFSGKLSRIAEDLATSEEDFGTGTWSLVAIALQNSGFLSSESCDVILNAFAAVLTQPELCSKFSAFFRFLNDLFVFWEGSPEVASEMASSAGGRNLMSQLFRVSCETSRTFGVDLSSLWLQGMKSSDAAATADFLAGSLSTVKSKLRVEVTDQLVQQAFVLLHHLKTVESESSWLGSWLGMIPNEATSTSSAVPQNDVDHWIMFSVDADVRLNLLKLSAASEDAEVASKRRATEFFLRSANLLLEEGSRADLNPALLNLLSLSVSCHLPEFSDTDELIGAAQLVVQRRLTVSAKEILLSAAFQHSKSRGREWSLALARILTWLADDQVSFLLI
jgi:hypothetical protein